MSLFEDLCKEHDIKVTTTKEIYKEFDPVGYFVYGDELDKICCAVQDDRTMNNKQIGLGTGNPEMAKWHEMGHLLHPLGRIVPEKYANHEALITELAASAWAIQNADDIDDMDNFVKYLQYCFSTYTRDWGFEVPDTEEIRELARILQVEDQMEWVNVAKCNTEV